MMNNTYSNSQGSRMGQAVIYESEAQRLQREADSFTKKYEHEKKRLMVLTTQVEAAQSELEEKKTSGVRAVDDPEVRKKLGIGLEGYDQTVRDFRKSMAANTTTMKDKMSLSIQKDQIEQVMIKRDGHTIKLLENQLDKALNHYNSLRSGNKSLRKDIDTQRKQTSVQQMVNRGYNSEIRGVAERVKKLNNVTQTGNRLSEETQNQILALKAKHDIDKFNFEHRIMDLQEKLQEKDEDQAEKSRTKDMGSKKRGTSVADFANPTVLLKIRLDKVVQNNKEKKNLMDMYIRNVNIIKDAFDQIKESTGIASIDEIVTTFIKAEEQNISLFHYVNVLNSEIDMIDEQNKNIEEELRRHKELGDVSANEKDSIKANLAKEIDEVKASTQAKDSQIKDIEQQMIQIKNYVWSMVENFKKSRFQLAVASHMQYDDETQFNENNVVMYLTELEEFISSFITFMAHREKNPDAHISALPLDIMTSKDFKADPISIDAPNAADFVSLEEETNADEELITDPIEKYRKFEELARSGALLANQAQRR